MKKKLVFVLLVLAGKSQLFSMDGFVLDPLPEVDEPSDDQDPIDPLGRRLPERVTPLRGDTRSNSALVPKNGNLTQSPLHMPSIPEVSPRTDLDSSVTQKGTPRQDAVVQRDLPGALPVTSGDMSTGGFQTGGTVKAAQEGAEILKEAIAKAKEGTKLFKALQAKLAEWNKVSVHTADDVTTVKNFITNQKSWWSNYKTWRNIQKSRAFVRNESETLEGYVNRGDFRMIELGLNGLEEFQKRNNELLNQCKSLRLLTDSQRAFQAEVQRLHDLVDVVLKLKALQQVNFSLEREIEKVSNKIFYNALPVNEQQALLKKINTSLATADQLLGNNVLFTTLARFPDSKEYKKLKQEVEDALIKCRFTKARITKLWLTLSTPALSRKFKRLEKSLEEEHDQLAKWIDAIKEDPTISSLSEFDSKISTIQKTNEAFTEIESEVLTEEDITIAQRAGNDKKLISALVAWKKAVGKLEKMSNLVKDQKYTKVSIAKKIADVQKIINEAQNLLDQINRIKESALQPQLSVLKNSITLHLAKVDQEFKDLLSQQGKEKAV